MMEIDVANNIKAVELLKVELMQAITDLFGDISAEVDSENHIRLANDSASIMIITKLLCKRLGIADEAVNAAMCRKLKGGIDDNHPLEKRFGDLSRLLSEIREDNSYNEYED